MVATERFSGMANGVGVGATKTVYEIGLCPDEQTGSFGAGAGHTLSIPVGSEVRLSFSAPAGRGPASFDVSSSSGSVQYQGVSEVRQVAGGRVLIGEGESDLVLEAASPGDATVAVRLLDDSGRETEVLSFYFNVA
jgi:hypothetical protein